MKKFTQYPSRMITASSAVRVYDLRPEHDSRASFYGKAQVLDYGNGVYELKSYDTIVARIENGEVTMNGLHQYSRTTDRHIREFLQQFGA
jgi:hypothetical protein